MLRKQAIKRNFFYWGKNAEETSLMHIIFAIFYAVIFSVVSSGGNTNTVQDTASQIWVYLLVFGAMVPAIATTSYGVAGAAVTISFGGKRSEVLWGIQFMEWLINVQVFLVVLLCGILADTGWEWIPMYAAMLLLMTALGQSAACAFFKYGAKGVWFLVIIIVIFVVGMGFIVGMWNDSFLTEVIENSLPFVFEYAVALVAASGAVIYAISVMILQKLLQNYEVKG